MNFLITGGTGFVGSYVIEKLIENDENVTIIDAFPDVDVSKRFSSQIEVVEQSILDKDPLTALVRQKKTDTIIHLASLRNTESQKKPIDAFQLNCQGMLNVIEVAYQCGIRRVVYASSVAVYGTCAYYRSLGIDPFYLDEEAPTHPGNFYGATKLFNEHIGAQFNKIYGVDSIGLRLSIIIGPGKKTGSQTSELQDIIEMPVRGKPVKIRTFNDQRINLLYVKDAAQALIKASYASQPGRCIYNVGGQNITTREIAAEVLQQFPAASIKIIETDEERGAASGINIESVRKDIGYEPLYPIQEAIADYAKSIHDGH